MLQALRNNTRTILWIVVASFVIFIILVWGADLKVGRSANRGVVGSVNGREIPFQLYQRQVSANLQNLRAQGQRQSTLEEERQTTEQTWKTLVDELLISEAAKKHALPVTDGEVVFWVKSSPPPQLAQNPAFLDSLTGRFDQARYEEMLRSSPEQFRWYEDLTRVQIPLDKLQRNVIASAKVSQGEVDAYIRDRYEQLRMSYLWVDPRRYPDPGAPVTPAEAKAYYDSHLDEFAAKERVKLLIARLPKTASSQDEASAMAEMTGYATTITRGEASFASLAESFSEDPFASAGGDRGRALRRQEIEPGLVERVFSAPLGQVTGPFRIDDRLLLMQVTGDTLIEKEPARRFATLERKIQPGADRMTELRTRAQAIVKAAGHGGLGAAALHDSVRVDTTGYIERGSFTPLLTGARDVLDRAFDMSPGQVSRPIEAEKEFLLFQVVDKKPAGALTFEEAAARAERGAARQRQLEIARPKAEAMAALVKQQGSLAAVAAAESLTVKDSGRFSRKGSIPEVGRDPELIAAAFAQPLGVTSGLIETDKGFFVVRPDSLFPPAAADQERYATSAKQVLLNERRNQIYEAWLADLREHAKIHDLRDRFTTM
ncbi:MAG TPA: peptidyl-prolyl cis-trans isomerase [Candidatus Udaeobacter sp.]|nr:peptidyl-prolyl cis-trans isomerase [Candidatus Udaeobacter sp.]